MWSSAIPVRNGSFELHIFIAILQRGWKAQPGGKSRGLGVLPGMEGRRFRLDEISGRQLISPLV